VYKENWLLEKIKNKVFNYNENDLKLNDYLLLYKPYAHWATSCQWTYDTEQFGALGNHIGAISGQYLGLMICSIVLYCLVFLTQIFTFDFGIRWKRITIVSTIILTVLEVAGYIALIVLYGILVGALDKLDTTQLQYAADNRCSDAVL
jgi:hypothetical protein